MIASLVFAWRGLTRRPLQTGLIGLALTVALSASLGMIAVLSGMNSQLHRDLAKVGTDVINIHINPTLSNVLSSPITIGDCSTIQEIAGGKVAPFEITLGVAESANGKSSARIAALSTTPTWDAIVPLDYIEGRFFRGGELGVCALDEWVAEKLFPDQSAVGQTIQLKRFARNETLTVVGVMKDPFDIRKRFDEMDITASSRSRMLRIMEFKSVYVPFEFESLEDPVHGAVAKVPDDRDQGTVINEIRTKLGLGDSIWVWSRRQWVAGILKGSNIASTIANVIWIIVLIVTGIMIATISLVAIRQRYREIAIRRTEGAMKRNILIQLVGENLILGLACGGLALLLCRTASFMEARYISWPPDYRFIDSFYVLALGIGLGALATYFPARRAAALDPVEVLSRS